MGLGVGAVNDGRMYRCGMIGWASIFYLFGYTIHLRSPMAFFLGGKIGCTKVLMAPIGDGEENVTLS